MSIAAFTKTEALINIAANCFVKPFAVVCCYNATGATITCCMRSKQLADALAQFLKANGEQDVTVRHTRRCGGEQHEVVLIVEN